MGGNQTPNVRVEGKDADPRTTTMAISQAINVKYMLTALPILAVTEQEPEYPEENPDRHRLVNKMLVRN